MDQYVRTVHQAAKHIQKHAETIYGSVQDSPLVVGLFAAVGMYFIESIKLQWLSY